MGIVQAKRESVVRDQKDQTSSKDRIIDICQTALSIHASRIPYRLGLVLRLLGHKSNLLIGVLGRGNEDVLSVCLEDEHIVHVDVVAPVLATERPEDNDSHNPEHAQEDTDAATYCGVSEPV